MNREKKITKKQAGQTLLEVIIALSAAVLIMSAVVVVVISALSNQQYGINQNQATQYAQEGLDVIRKASQSSWTAFAGYSPHYCLDNNSSLTPSATCTVANVGSPNLIYVREIALEFNSTTCGPTPAPPVSTSNVKVTSTVSWADGRCQGGNQFCHKVELISCFYKP